jgi:hypothetical protein
VNVVETALSSVPAMLDPPVKPESRTGKFWVRFEPPSASSASLALTPVPLMSMPSAVLSWIELPRMTFPAPALTATRTPALLL